MTAQPAIGDRARVLECFARNPLHRGLVGTVVEALQPFPFDATFVQSDDGRDCMAAQVERVESGQP